MSDRKSTEGTTKKSITVDEAAVDEQDTAAPQEDLPRTCEESETIGDRSRTALTRRSLLSVAGGAAGAVFAPGAAAGSTDGSHELVVRSDSALSYEFTATGPVTGRTDTGRNSAELWGDGVVDNGDGTYTVTGYTGDGYGDAFTIDGAVTAFVPDSGDFELRWDGQRVTLPELTGASEHTLEIVADDECSYEFSVGGSVRRLVDEGRNAAELWNDDVVYHGDGTVTVSGYTGDGYGDSFGVVGDVTTFTPTTGAFELRYDGERVTVPELTGVRERTVEVTSPGEISYEFTATGPVRLLLEHGRTSAEEGNDAVVENPDGTYTVTGYTGNGYGDGFAVQGEVTAFSPMRGDFTLLVDGEETTAAELTGIDPPAPSSAVIGGGKGYPDVVTRSEADYTAKSRSGLADALRRASAGDVVFVAGDAAIDLSGTTLTIPTGVTLASDRGNGENPGGLVYQTDGGHMFTENGDVTVTGLRLRGPLHDEHSPNGPDASGISFANTGGEIANCEVSGWGYYGIRDRADTHVHHCHVHHNANAGLGYGVLVSPNRECLVEYTLFGRNRHCIAAHSTASYTARNNVVEADQRHHAFDHHDAGGSVEIFNNTFRMMPATVEGYPCAYNQRECATDTHVHHNWMYNATGPRIRGERADWNDGSLITECGNWTGWDVHDNHYGETAPPDGVGAP